MSRYNVFLKKDVDYNLFKEEIQSVGINILSELSNFKILTIETSDTSIFNHIDIESIMKMDNVNFNYVSIYENFIMESEGIGSGQMIAILAIEDGKNVSDVYSSSSKLVDDLYKKLKGSSDEKIKKIKNMLRYGMKAGKNKALFKKGIEYINNSNKYNK